jgi:hypothetical protein
MRTRRSYCITSVLASGLAALAVAPAALAGTNVQLIPHRFLAPPTTRSARPALGSPVTTRLSSSTRTAPTSSISAGSRAPARRS